MVPDTLVVMSNVAGGGAVVVVGFAVVVVGSAVVVVGRVVVGRAVVVVLRTVVVVRLTVVVGRRVVVAFLVEALVAVPAAGTHADPPRARAVTAATIAAALRLLAARTLVSFI